MDKVKVEVVDAERLQRLVEGRLNIFWRVEGIPQLRAHSQYQNVQSISIQRARTLDVSQTWSRGTPLAFNALPTSSSFCGPMNVSLHT